MTEPILLSLGAGVPSGAYEAVHSRFRTVVNFIRGDRIISLCDGSHAPGPFRIVIGGFVPELVTSMELSETILILNGTSHLSIRPECLYHVPIFAEITDYTFLRRNLADVRRYLDVHASPESLPKLLNQPSPDPLSYEGQYLKSLRAGLELLKQAKYREAALALRRRGMGLTPAGDDLLCGFLIAASWLEQVRKKELSEIRQSIYFTALANDLMVNTFLYQGYALLVDADWAEFLAELSHSEVLNYYSVERLLRHGASSGADQLLGFCLAAELLGT